MLHVTVDDLGLLEGLLDSVGMFGGSAKDCDSSGCASLEYQIRSSQ